MRLLFEKLIGLFKSTELPTKKELSKPKKKVTSTRIGELGEYKIDIQLDQLPKNYRYLSDLLLPNPKSKTGYSQIDHVVITPYAIFVIETKNYNGEIKGGRDEKHWRVSNRFNIYNPLLQNYGHIKVIEKLVSSMYRVNFVSMISFTMRARFSVDPELRKIHSNDLIVYDTELSEYINRKVVRLKTETSEPILTDSDIQTIYEVIKASNITDSKRRQEHMEKAKGINRNKK
ncbi:MAG: nuclease-related domain-containing protein [Ignavibacteriales bacterium]